MEERWPLEDATEEWKRLRDFLRSRRRRRSRRSLLSLLFFAALVACMVATVVSVF